MNILFILVLSVCPVLVFGSHRSTPIGHESEISDNNSVAQLTASSSSIAGSRSHSGTSGSAARSYAYSAKIDDPNVQHTEGSRYARNEASGRDGEVTKVYLYDVHPGKGQQRGRYSFYYDGKEGGVVGRYSSGEYQAGQHGAGNHDSEAGKTHFTGTATKYVTGKTKISITGRGPGYTSDAGQDYSSDTGSDYTSGSAQGYSSGSQYPSNTGYGDSGDAYSSGFSSDSGYEYGSGAGRISGSGQENSPGTSTLYHTTGGSKTYSSVGSKTYSSGGSKDSNSGTSRRYTSGHSRGYSSGSGKGRTSQYDDIYNPDEDDITYIGTAAIKPEYPRRTENKRGSTGNGGYYSHESGNSYTPQTYNNVPSKRTEIVVSSNGYNPAGGFPDHSADTSHTSGTTSHSSGTVYTYPSGKGYTPGVGKISSGTGQYSGMTSDAGTTRHTASTRHTKSHKSTSTEYDDEHEHDQSTEKMPSTRRITASTYHTKTTIEDGRGKPTKNHHSDHEVQSGSTIGQCNCNKFEVAYQWNYFNFSWNCPLKMAQMRYSPADYIPLSFDIYNHSLYMTFPRLRRNSRITLAKMSLVSSIVNPDLIPFPSLEMNSGNTCDTLQDVTKIQIDKDGVMWVLDGRRLNPAVNCPPKMMLLDLKHNGKIVKKYDIPDDLCKKHGCLLNDLVVDGDYAFISDLSAGEEGIIVYNRRKNKSWKARAKGLNESNFRHHNRENCSPKMYNHEISRSVAWIALAPPCSSKNRTFLYIPESLPYGFGINIDILKDERKATGDLARYFTQEFSKRGATGAAIYDSKGTLFLGMLSERTVAFKYFGQKELMVCPRMHNMIRYPGTFAIDNDSGSVFMLEMSSLNFAMTGVDVRKVNFKILKLKTESKNYMHCTARN